MEGSLWEQAAAEAAGNGGSEVGSIGREVGEEFVEIVRELVVEEHMELWDWMRTITVLDCFYYGFDGYKSVGPCGAR